MALVSHVSLAVLAAADASVAEAAEDVADVAGVAVAADVDAAVVNQLLEYRFQNGSLYEFMQGSFFYT